MSEDAHARPTRDAPEPLYDVNTPTPTHAERARTLVAQISTGTLCTLALEPEGYPATEITSASMTGVDRYGFEMSAMTSQGPRPVRLAFGQPVSTPEEVRTALISMAKEARSKLG
jgi:putative heme iron utilization protein